MNYDLAMMALDGLTRAPLTVRADAKRVTITGNAASFKELARLCLLLGGAAADGDSFELQPSVHVGKDSPGVKLELT
jgi:hypothetical protein